MSKFFERMREIGDKPEFKAEREAAKLEASLDIAKAEIAALRATVAGLEKRLEVDPRTKLDGIDCRDITIREQDRLIDELAAEIARLRGVFDASVVAHGALFGYGTALRPRPDSPALESIWLAIDAALASTKEQHD